MTRAMQALSPLLKHPRATIAKVEGLVLAAAGVLLLQLLFGFYRRRWRSSVLSTVLGVRYFSFSVRLLAGISVVESVVSASQRPVLRCAVSSVCHRGRVLRASRVVGMAIVGSFGAV
jgi:hypothetical protein